MQRSFYRPELDALRFFAFFCVFCTHARIHAHWVARFQEMGAYGMSIFFVLSAYLIVTILLREKSETGSVDLKRFVIRRVLRIWPLYFAMLFGACLLGFLWTPAHIGAKALIAFSFLAGNVYILKAGWALGPSNALWSLSVEEQFYLAIPLLSKIGSRRSLAAIFAATIALAYAVLLWTARAGANPLLQLWPNSFVQFQFFAVGGLIALLTQHDPRGLTPGTFPPRTAFPRNLSASIRLSLLLAGLLLWTFATLWFPVTGIATTGAIPLCVGYFLILCGTSAIFLAVLGADVRVPASLVYLGKISYGLYLFHSFFFYLLRDTPPAWMPKLILDHAAINVPLALAATIASAALSYRYFEKPILQFKQRFETVRTRPA